MKKHFSIPAVLVLLGLTLSGCIWYGPHGGYGRSYGGGGYGDSGGGYGGGYGHGGPGGGWNHH
jgi:hypothetical protein